MDINAKSEPSKKTTQSKGGFLQSLFAGLFKSSNPEAERKRQLKLIAKNFSKTKFHTYYKPSTIEILPNFAKLLYDIYKLVSQSQLLFRGNPNNNFFKQKIINFCLSDKQLELIEHFDEQKILDMARQLPLNKLEAQLSADMEVMNSEFDSNRIARTENLYKSFMLFKDFCSFDYYVILRKFYSALIENNFGATPTFDKINAEYIADDLKDFCVVAYAITNDTIVWTDLFNFLKQVSSAELISLNNWKKIVAKIRAIQASKAFEYMIKHITGNPDYETTVPSQNASVVEPYLDKLQEEMHSALSKISNQQKESKANQIVVQIFGNGEYNNLHNYVAGINEGLIKKELNTYLFTEPLNYLKTFLLEYLKKDIREYYDVVVIRGQWDAGLSSPFSNAYQELLKISENITKFDNDLAEDGVTGAKIKTLLPKTAHDPGAENIINRLISDSNEQAKGYLITSTQHFVTIGKILKQLIEDYVKQKPLIVHNWRELERYLDHPMKDFSVNIYKKIYLFVQLMQQYLSE